MHAQLDSANTALVARLFVRELDARGLDSGKVLAAAGLTRDLVSAAGEPISWAQCLRLIDEALALAPSGDLGVLAGRHVDLSHLALAGLYLRSAPNARAALQFHLENRAMLDPSGVSNIYTTDDAVVIALLAQESSPARAALAEFMLATSIAMVRAITGALTPIEACFRHGPPADVRAHISTFGSVRFNSGLDALFLPIELLDRALPHRDETIRSVLEPYVAQQLELAQAARADLASRALNGIRQELAQGRASVDSLARQLRMSPRSLRRGLGALDTSYSDLLANARRDLAMQHALESPRKSGPDIARLLGYADAHTFYRAFKRWTGVPLSAYRKQGER